jgi:hypothetical protein
MVGEEWRIRNAKGKGTWRELAWGVVGLCSKTHQMRRRDQGRRKDKAAEAALKMGGKVPLNPKRQRTWTEFMGGNSRGQSHPLSLA